MREITTEDDPLKCPYLLRAISKDDPYQLVRVKDCGFTAKTKSGLKKHIQSHKRKGDIA